MDVSVVWFLFFLWAVLGPMVRHHRLERARVATLLQLQRKRRSRVITLIHRQESLSILGIPLARFINIEDSEAILRAIRLTPPDVPIDLVLHTPGGLVLASEQIARALLRHRGRVTVFVPHYAMSGGTLIALAADRIVMDENAVLGPVDPQIGGFPAASILKVVREKKLDEVDDKTLMLADVAEKAVLQVRAIVTELLAQRMDPAKAEVIAEALTEGRWTHDFPIDPDKLAQLGIGVQVGLPPEVYALMELYPQPPQRRPSVQFIPVPFPDTPAKEPRRSR